MRAATMSSPEIGPKPVTASDIIVEPPLAGVVDPRNWFGGRGPLEIEIGCGKGGFLLHRRRTNPEVNLLGIEWANKFFKFAADRMHRWAVTNVRIMRTNANVFVQRHLAPSCVSALHLYHPDPWPKKRHHKRRLVQLDFAQAAVRALQPSGWWLIQTDHAGYFEHIVSVIRGVPELRDSDWPAFLTDVSDEWKGTNFEIKYAREGRRIFRQAYQKRPIVLAGKTETD